MDLPFHECELELDHTALFAWLEYLIRIVRRDLVEQPRLARVGALRPIDVLV